MNICRSTPRIGSIVAYGQQQLGMAAAVFHVDAQAHEDRRVRRPRDRGKARIGLDPVDVQLDRRQRLERKLGIGEYNLDHAFDEVGLDGRIGTALDPHRALTAPAPSSTSMIE